MATAVLSLNTWSVEYYETMAAAERARLKITQAQRRVPSGVRLFASVVLFPSFRTVVHETEKLVACLSQLEAVPSSVLLEEDVGRIPESLRDLFQKMCGVIQKSEALGLHESLFLGTTICQLGGLSQQISGFADRFEDAQKKLRSRVSADEATQYKEAFEAYEGCEPAPEQATDEDVKRQLLHF
jgi:hypothetical protein